MILEFHDNEIENTLVARIRDIDFLYQAEQWIIDTLNDAETQNVISWKLLDAEGGSVLRIWERPIGSNEMPTAIFPKADPSLN